MFQIPTKRIALIYGQYPNSNLELEARFGTFEGNHFIPSLSREVYNRLFETFSNNRTNILPAHEITRDYVEGSLRRTVYELPIRSDVWISKNNLRGGRFDLFDYGIRINLAEEIISQPNPTFSPTFARRKDRYSFLLLGGAARLDLTLVTPLMGNKQGEISYEVEVELLDRRYLPQFSSTIETLLRSIQDTTLIYTKKEKEEVFAYLNGLLGQRPESQSLNPGIIVQARNLNMRDLVWGGIVGNPETAYAVAHKADGIRRLLAFTPTGIWFLLPKIYATLVDKMVVPALTGTVLEGELIPKGVNRKNGPRSKYWFLTYDCLAAGGDRGIQNTFLINRRAVCQGIADKFKDNPLLSIWTKSLKILDVDRQGLSVQTRVDHFFKVMRDLFEEQNHLNYEQDGFIFTPSLSPYNPGADKKPLSQRVLTRYPDIVKWKPRQKMTIDFSIGWHNDQVVLYSGEKGKLVPFEGSSFNSFEGKVENNPITQTLSSGTIVEYSFDFETNSMVPVRVRNDKTVPNRLDVALSNWDWIHDPVKKESLIGEGFDLVFKYHNRIKKALFQSVGKNRTLLDIGSGRGGDVAKWKDFSRIVAVEPNPDYLPELERRITLHGLEDRVLILPTGGEDTTTIVQAVEEFLGGRADVGSLMLSMSFFWSSSEMLEGLAATLREGIKAEGEIIFFTIDGALVSEMFDPSLRGLKIDQLQLGNATFEYRSERELYVDIPGTIVERQREWLVHLYDLSLRIQFEISHLHRADTEKFLSAKEAIYTQMYTFGQMSQKKGPPVRPEMKERALQPHMPTIPKLARVPEETCKSPCEQLGCEKQKKEESIRQALHQLPKPITLTLTKKTKELPWLPVRKPDNLEDPAIGDDLVQALNVPWYQNVVRIADIGDGSCFFHALLKAVYQPYQENNSYAYRTDLVTHLRRDIAYTLQRPATVNGEYLPLDDQTLKQREELGYLKNQLPVDYRYKINYETASDGAFPNIYLVYLHDQAMDFSLPGLQRLLNSCSDLGDEVYGYVANLFDLDIFVMYIYLDNLKTHIDTLAEEKPKRPSIVIGGNGEHYEVIAIKTPEGYQTVFLPDDPFINQIIYQKRQTGREKEIPKD